MTGGPTLSGMFIATSPSSGAFPNSVNASARSISTVTSFPASSAGPSNTTIRSQTDAFGKQLYNDDDLTVVDRVTARWHELGVPFE